jgi:chemotaxis protein CheC
MENEIQLTDLQKDALKETANIGAGQASNTLSSKVNKKVNIVVSDLNLIPLNELQKFIGGQQQMVVGIYTPLHGDMNGTVIVIFPIESAVGLSSILQQKTESSKTLSDEDKVALQSMGNLLSDSYLNALSDFLDMSVKREESKIVSTFGESVSDLILLSIDQESTHGFLIKTNFSIENSSVNGDFVLLLTAKKIDIILEKIKAKIG